LDIGNEISSDLKRIENIQRLANARGLLVAMDSNARSTTWHDSKTNKRGRILDEFLISNRLYIAHKESAVTIFESTRGTSNIDLTVADNKMIKLLHTWQCNGQESFSDHRYINFAFKNIELYYKTSTIAEQNT